MKKQAPKGRRAQQRRNRIFLGCLIAIALFLIVLFIVKGNSVQQTGYVITEDGHVHTTDGAHVGTVEEVFGENFVITDDGHVHTEDGAHIGTYEGEEVTEHTEDDGHNH